jgi:hypothetical protein
MTLTAVDYTLLSAFGVWVAAVLWNHRPRKHQHELTEVKEDGYQYCKTCGIAVIPKAHSKKERDQCMHILEDLDRGSTIITGANKAHQTVVQQRCIKCGKRFTYNATASAYAGEVPATAEGGAPRWMGLRPVARPEGGHKS